MFGADMSKVKLVILVFKVFNIVFVFYVSLQFI